MSSTRVRRPGNHQLVLRLYVAGQSPNSLLARDHLRAAIADIKDMEVALELVDVLQEPERSREDGVVVTPTLIRVAPHPQRRVVGNLRDRRALFAGLGLAESTRE